MKQIRRLLILAIFAAWTGSLTAQTVNKDNLRESPKIIQVFRDVVARPSESVVRVLADSREVALGTIVDSDGWILTKWDAVRGKSKIVCLLKDNTECDATVVGADKDYDLVLLKVDAKSLPAVEWGEAKEVKVGQWVASPSASSKPAAIGVISVATRALKQGDQPSRSINANAGWLGVGLDDDPVGAKISMISPKSPAQAAGIKVNDIVFEAAGRKIVSSESLINTIQRFKPGDEIALKIKRGDEDLETQVKLAKIPKNMLGNPQESMGGDLSIRRGGFPFILQHDSVLKPHDCGGPLVDLDGRTIGINLARAGRTETYAIPVDKVVPLIEKLKTDAAPPKEDTSKVMVVPKASDIVWKADSSLTKKDPVEKHRGEGRFMKTYEVQLSAGVAYSIEMKSLDVDPYLILENAQGKKVAEDDDSGGDFNAKIVFRPTTDGFYRIVATTSGQDKTGAFTLTVRKKAVQSSVK